MTQLTDPTSATPAIEVDPGDAVHRVLQASTEPLTLAKIRSLLPTRFRKMDQEELAEMLRRQVAANVVYQFPRYRSQHDRFWDRPMAVHVAALLKAALEDEPLGWSELRRSLPAYAISQAEAVLHEQIAQRQLFRHPRSGRGVDRFGTKPPDPKTYLRAELPEVFQRLEKLGFSAEQLRESALELLHDEEWALLPPAQETRPAPEPAATLPTQGGEIPQPQAEMEPRVDQGTLPPEGSSSGN
jgi:hypothetical protein